MASKIILLLLKFLLIFAILLIFVIVLDKLMKQRVSIKEGAATTYTEDPLAIAEAKSKVIPKDETPAGTSSCTVTNLQVKDYCIKGSANSAFSGSYTSMEMVNYVLSRGVRFLDLQVFWIDSYNGKKDACVGFTSDKLSYAPNGVKNKQIPPLSMILSTILSNAFVQKQGSAYVTTNPLDPLFVQIRMQTDSKTIPELYNRIQEVLKSQLSDSDYSYGNKQVSRFTSLSQIKQKILIGFNSDEYYVVRPSGNDPSDYTNFLTNSETIKRLTFKEVDPTYNVNIMPPKTLTQYTTDVSDFIMVAPDNDTEDIIPNPNPFHAIKLYGIQIILNQYYSVDTNLINSEIMYSSRFGGIVPMSLCLGYINNTAEPADTSIPTK